MVPFVLLPVFPASRWLTRLPFEGLALAA